MKKRRSDEAIRQSYVTERRLESGLVTKKFHFSNGTINELKRIGQDMGFSESELRLNENLSTIIELCVDSFSAKLPEEKAVKKDALYLKQLYNIIKFREDKGYHDGAIADFLADWEYKTPWLVKPDTGNFSRKLHWTPELVARLKNDEYIQDQVEVINNRPKRKERKRNKVKISKSSSRERYSDEFFHFK